jgi:hypothetical protein
MEGKLKQLAQQNGGDFDDTTMRTLYADASAYREMPLAVAIQNS